MPLLFLARHALAAPPGLMVGRADFSLSPEGEAQAAELRDALAGTTFTAAWCSPLSRAGRTARVILSGNPRNVSEPVMAPGFIEISLGAWEGLSKKEARRGHPEIWDARGKDFMNVAPPGGESMAMLAARVRSAFAALRREAARHEYSLLVAHQAVNRVIIADSTGLPLERLMEIAQPPAAVSVLEVGRDGARLLGVLASCGLCGL